ncbi:hypothetical protein Agub_g9947, partial [Astrephomene gubernaculifera]
TGFRKCRWSISYVSKIDVLMQTRFWSMLARPCDIPIQSVATVAYASLARPQLLPPTRYNSFHQLPQHHSRRAHKCPQPATSPFQPLMHTSALTASSAPSSAITATALLHVEEEPPAPDPDGWRLLGAPPEELQLDFCLPTGQSFRWRRTGDGQYTGVIGNRLVCLRQHPDDVSYRVLARCGDCCSPASPSPAPSPSPASHSPAASPAASDHAALRDYFQLHVRLGGPGGLAAVWAEACGRFRQVAPYFPGARMLRQDPLECLFQFICSSNNHIARIHAMVERLCSMYGTPLLPPGDLHGGGEGGAAVLAKAAAGAPPVEGAGLAKAAAGAPPGSSPGGGGGLSYFAFPSLEQLAGATEQQLREAGFGYRARFIVGAVAALRSKPGGGREWLRGLRGVPLAQAEGALQELPGIGPKVAACICLFSLDQPAALPVDTHVWALAGRHYCPQLAGRAPSPRLHGLVAGAFRERFGEYAGWAHNTLFISELASQQHRLPPHLREGGRGAAGGAGGKGAGGGGKRRGRKRLDDDEEDDTGAEEEEPGVSNGTASGGSGCGEEGMEEAGGGAAALTGRGNSKRGGAATAAAAAARRR